MQDSLCFNPRPPCGGRRWSCETKMSVLEFQSTPPVRGATPAGGFPSIFSAGFNPRPPCGGRQTPVTIAAEAERFQSTPPVRGATTLLSCAITSGRFQSTPPVRGATRDADESECLQRVSIHAPRAGGDVFLKSQVPVSIWFQSTPPVRGATKSMYFPATSNWGFNPRPPCGGRRHGCNCLHGKMQCGLLCERDSSRCILTKISKISFC